MADKFRFFHRARVRAPVSVCWDVFADHERIGDFTNTPTKIIKAGTPDRNGLGCIRVLGAFGWRVEEIVNIWRPYEVFGYHVINSEMIDAHQGVVRFFSTSDNGCEWVYDMQNIPNQRALDAAQSAGVPYHDFMGVGFTEYMMDLEAECERRADQERIPALPPPTSTTTLG